MEKYYSSIKTYSKRKRIHPFYKFNLFIFGLFFPKNEIVWQTKKPEKEPIFYVCNHTRLYAPKVFLLQKPKIRPWSNYQFLSFKTCYHHMFHKILKYVKCKWLLYPLSVILIPFIVLLFRAIEPIPVYHSSSKTVTETFKKSIETMESGTSQVIFPERTDIKANKYIHIFYRGFTLVASEYYKKTGKKLKFYPVYCATKLRKLLVGEPIEYNPEIPMKIQRETICTYLENAIAKLGDSLPNHKPDVYVERENDNENK